jgi:HEAT repeat protein
LLLGFLENRDLVHPALEALGSKELAGRVPVQPLLDLYERDTNVRVTILEALSNMRYPVTNTLLINEISNTYPNSRTGRLYPLGWQRLLGQKTASPLLTERLALLEERCFPPSIRAIALLGHWQERRAVHVLLKALTDERWSVSDTAASELCKRADALVQADLLVLLKHTDAWVRKNALQVLAECTHLPPLQPLVAVLHDSSDQVRAAAARALRKQVEDAPLDELLAATLDKSTDVCREAAVTLIKLGQRDPVLAVTGSINLLQREAAIDESSGRGEFYTLLKAIAEVFGELSSFAPAEILLQAMYDLATIKIRPTNDIQTSPHLAASALGQMGEHAPIAQLAHALKDQNPDIQRAAAFALSLTGKRAPVEALIEALTRQKNYRVRKEVIAALIQISEHGMVPDEIFLQQILDQRGKYRNYETYEPLFRAFTTQGKRIPEEIVVDALEHFPHKSIPVVIHYLLKFVELLPAFPL